MEMCKRALANGPKTTQELATQVMTANGLDAADKMWQGHHHAAHSYLADAGNAEGH
jgi:hypothetical protein